MNLNRLILTLAAALPLVVFAACSGDDDDGGSTPTPAPTASPSPTVPPPSAADAAAAYDAFAEAVNAGELTRAWELYIASVPGTTEEYLADQGCSYDAFTVEFPRIQHMFARITPTTTTGTFSDAPNSPVIEFTMTGADGQHFLVTLERVPVYNTYRMKWMNNGATLFATPVGTAAPLPSPEDPQGICGIWTGGR
jgi:hypothetical protein